MENTGSILHERQRSEISEPHWRPGSGALPGGGRVAPGHGRVLVTDCVVPLYDNDAGSLYMWNMIKLFLKLDWKVTFYPENLTPIQPYTSELQQMDVKVIYGQTTFPKFIQEHSAQFELALLRRPDYAFHKLDLIRTFTPSAKIIYDTVDLHFLREQRRAAVERDLNVFLSSVNYKAMELYLAKFSDLTFTVTEVERQHLLRLDPSLKVAVIPIIHSVPDGTRPAFNHRAGLIFLGNYAHAPNIDAVKWFVAEIWPAIRQKLPDVLFYIIGSNAPRDFAQLETIPGVKVIGRVPEVGPWFDRCRVFVSPLRYGAGMKGKIGHAMSYGLPVVTTGMGAEGMQLEDGETALIAESPTEFANAAVKLYGSSSLWQQLAVKALAHVQKYYTPQVVKERLAAALKNLGCNQPDA